MNGDIGSIIKHMIIVTICKNDNDRNSYETPKNVSKKCSKFNIYSNMLVNNSRYNLFALLILT